MAVTDASFNPSGNELVTTIKEEALDFEAIIKATIPSGRRQALALTHLEIATMFAVKAATVGDD